MIALAEIYLIVGATLWTIYPMVMMVSTATIVALALVVLGAYRLCRWIWSPPTCECGLGRCEVHSAPLPRARVRGRR